MCGEDETTVPAIERCTLSDDTPGQIRVGCTPSGGNGFRRDERIQQGREFTCIQFGELISGTVNPAVGLTEP